MHGMTNPWGGGTGIEFGLLKWPYQNISFSQFFPTKLQGAKVLEIGCGTGLAGVVAAQLGAFTMFSDMVPITLEAVKESCRLNHISNFDTCMLDWSETIEPKERL